MIVCLSAATGCAPSSTDQVREVGGGTYAIGVRGVALTEQSEALGEAVRKAGAFCHAKGQKIQVVTNTGGDDVHFRCIGSLDPPAAEPAKQETH
jgi:hypothetical protein